MTTGELWVSSPLFPILVWILATWVLFATAVFARNWFRLRRLERYTKLLEALATEGVGNVAKQIKELKEEFRRSKRKRKRRRGKSKHARIQSEAPAAAAIETVTENGDDISSVGDKDSEGTESGSPATVASVTK